MVPVAGRPLIDHALQTLSGVDLTHVVVNTHHQPLSLEAHLAGRRHPQIRLSREKDLLRETGGGIRHARDLLGCSPIFTLNADAVWSGDDPARTLTLAWSALPEDAEACLLVLPRDRAVGHKGVGDFFLEGTRLVRRGTAPAAPYVYTGFQILRPGAVYDWPDQAFSLNPVWDAMIARGTLHGALFGGAWCDVGQPESLPLAEAMLRS